MTLMFIFFSGASVNYLDDTTSVNPEFRTAKCTLSCGGGWRDSNNNTVMAEAVQGFAGKLHQYGTGVYFNEPDYNLENWKVSITGFTINFTYIEALCFSPDTIFYTPFL